MQAEFSRSTWARLLRRARFHRPEAGGHTSPRSCRMLMKHSFPLIGVQPK